MNEMHRATCSCPERWVGSAPIRALELTEPRVCLLCSHSLACLTAQLWSSLTSSHRRVWAQKATAGSPPSGILWEKTSSERRSIHPSILVPLPLDLPMKGRAESWSLGWNHCRARKLEGVYFFIGNMEDNMVWILNDSQMTEATSMSGGRDIKN